jgi:hypothetical protein
MDTKIDLSLLKKTIENVTFGIEIETCFHILDSDIEEKTFSESVYYDENDVLYSDTKKDYAIKLYNDCMIKKEKNDKFGIKWNTSNNVWIKDELKYQKWSIVDDVSVNCKIEKYRPLLTCNKNGHKTNKKDCNDLKFYSIEIITPKLIGTNGLKTLMYTWYSYIYSDNIVYMSNRTQGLHINLSYPKMIHDSFLYTWVIYEPIIIQLLPSYRRKVIDTWAVPIHKLGTDLYINRDKLYSVRKGNDRLEVRIGEGSIDFFDVYFWNIFCITIFAISVISKITNYYNYSTVFDYTTNEGKIKAFYSLLDLIQDTDIQKMLLDRYRKNKENTWPNITYTPSNINIVQHPWKNFTEQEQKMMYDLRYIYC